MQDSIPQSKEAEAAVLGSMILGPEQIPFAEDEIKVEMFYSVPNQIIYESLLKQYEKYGVKLDLVLVRDGLKGSLKKIGGIKYVVEVMESVPTSANLQYYIGIMKECHMERCLLRFAAETIKVVSDDDGTAEDKYVKVSKALSDSIANNMDTKSSNIKDTIMDVNFELAGSYIETGYKSLDNYIYGLGNGDMITIAGRPSMGKTAIMLDLTLNMMNRVKDKAVALFSLEMPAEKIQQRLLCMLTKIDIGKALKGELSPNQQQYLEDAKEVLRDSMCNLIVDTTAGITPAKLKAKILRMNLQHGLSAVFIDRIGLMRTDGWKGAARWEKVTEISNMIKSIAMQVEIPIVVLAQLNRDVDKRDNKRPRLSDLRHSGAIEEDSNVVLMLYRPGYYDKDAGDEAEIIIAKNTQGKTGMVELMFESEYAHFEEKVDK